MVDNHWNTCHTNHTVVLLPALLLFHLQETVGTSYISMIITCSCLSELKLPNITRQLVCITNVNMQYIKFCNCRLL